MRGTERETGGRNLDNARKPNAPAKTLNASVTQILRYFARPPSHVQLRDKKTRPANHQPPPPPPSPAGTLHKTCFCLLSARM